MRQWGHPNVFLLKANTNADLTISLYILIQIDLRRPLHAGELKFSPG